MDRRTLALWALTPLLACSDDGAAGSGGTDTDGTASASMSASATETATPTSTTAGSADGSGEASSDSEDSGPNLCGNGELDQGEQCDDGAANSDDTPDACRTDCVRPYCYDGVTDPSLGEECDDGDLNGPDPDKCRADCMLPRCGDGIQDTGESCDDGNEEWGDTCFACENRYYFFVNAGGGSTSIVRSTRDDVAVELVAADGTYNDVEHLALSNDALSLFALQSGGGVHRVLAFDPVGGALQSEVDFGTAVLGYEPTAHAMATGADGLLYVALTGDGSNRLIQIDPKNPAPLEVLDFGNTDTIVDMVADDNGGLFLTTGPQNSIVAVDTAGFTASTLATGLVNPLGIAFDVGNQTLWTVNSPAGGPAQSVAVDLDGTVTLGPIAGTVVDPQMVGVGFDVGGVVLGTIPAENRIVAIQMFDMIQDVFTDGLAEPRDILIHAM